MMREPFRLIEGGQGRSSEDVQASAAHILVAAACCIGFWVLLWIAWRLLA